MGYIRLCKLKSRQVRKKTSVKTTDYSKEHIRSLNRQNYHLINYVHTDLYSLTLQDCTACTNEL